MDILLVLTGYACGSIPVGVLLARRAGVDPRAAGSGNIGATNVARTAGARVGLATLLGDIAKGALPMLLATRLGAGPSLLAATAVAAVAGHVFPITLGFRGGKGVATTAGVLVVLCPGVCLTAGLVFALSFTVARIVSVASLSAALMVPLGLVVLGYPAPTVWAGGTIAALIWLRHGQNLSRLMDGTEPKFSVHKG